MDLEITSETVSRLVLGHLRSENHKAAYKEFLHSCKHFGSQRPTGNKVPYIQTRLHGLSLVHILQEYAAIYNIVQKYLDGVGYFKNHKRSRLIDLVDELEYLLSLTGAKFDLDRSRSSTPIRSIPNTNHINDHLSPIVEIVEAECEVNTTALQDLPGNSAESSRRSEASSKQTEELNDVVRESPDKSGSSSNIDCSLERIHQTILEHPEFQAKIAENINSIINCSVSSASKENVDKVPELDATIKMILQKTEEDPLFERLLEDIIGDATSVNYTNVNVESQDGMLHTPKKLTSPGNAATIKQRLRSSRKTLTGFESPGLETCNNDVIDKIVAAAANSQLSESAFATGTTAGSVMAVSAAAGQDVVSISAGAGAGANAIVTGPNVEVPIATPLVNNTEPATASNTLSNAGIILYDGPIDTLFQNQNQNQNRNPVATTSTAVLQNSAITTTSAPGFLMLQPNQVQQQQSQMQQLSINTIDDSSSVNMAPANDASKYFMISENGQMISIPQVVMCTDSATSQAYMTAPQSNALPSTGPKYRLPSSEKNANSLVELFSSYDPNEASTSNYPKRRPEKNETQPVKRIKTILPKPIIKIEILPIPQEESVAPMLAVLDNTGIIENLPSLSADDRETPMVVTPDVPTTKKSNSSTPKSGPHVRALDFNFVTPAKDAADKTSKPNKKESKNGKTVKSLFSTPAKPLNKKNTAPISWDASLRELAIRNEEPEEEPTIPAPTTTISNPEKPTVVPEVDSFIKQSISPDNEKPADLNSTEVDADSIEKALQLEKESPKSVEPPGELRRSPRKSLRHTAKVVKKSLRMRKFSETSPGMDIVDKSPKTVAAVDALLELSKPVEIEAEVERISKSPEAVPLLPVVPMEITTPPSTTKSRIKRKCNMDSTIKHEVTVTKIKEIKSLDILTESGAKLILSPSKLANKRTLLTVDKDQPSDYKMNMPILETPVKFNPYSHPTTPNFLSPLNTTITPFTKVFNEQTEGIDISAIPTPKLPITPSLNLTPFMIDQSGGYNRPTDYSTSSSYYQPSDSEQNKSLEKAIMEECKGGKLTNPLVKTTDITKNVQNCQETQTQTDILAKILEEDVRKTIPEETKSIEPKAETLAAIAAVMKTTKNTIGIGRKNLNLIPKDRSDSSSDSDDSTCSSRSSSSSSNSDSDESIYHKTVIKSSDCNNYSLRSKTASPAEVPMDIPEVKCQAAAVINNDIHAIVSSTNFKSELKSTAKVDEVVSNQDKVLQDLEAKRKRTIAKFKSTVKRELPKVLTTKPSRGVIKKAVTKGDETVDQNKTPKLAKMIKTVSEVQKGTAKSKNIKTITQIKPVKEPIKKVVKATKPKTSKTKTPPRFKKSPLKAKNTKRKSPAKPQKPVKKSTAIQHDLNPLDIVETHMSEHSAASTPVHEEQPPRKQTQAESHCILQNILSSVKQNNIEIIYKNVDKKNRIETCMEMLKGKGDKGTEKTVASGHEVSIELVSREKSNTLKQKSDSKEKLCSVKDQSDKKKEATDVNNRKSEDKMDPCKDKAVLVKDNIDAIVEQTRIAVETIDKTGISKEVVDKISKHDGIKDKNTAVAECNISSDVEAEKLVKGLKQWGIHLVPKPKPSEKSEAEEAVAITIEDVSARIDEDMARSVMQKQDYVFVNKLYTESDIIHYQYNPASTNKAILNYDVGFLTKQFTSRIYIDELSRDVEIPLTVSPFVCLFEMESEEIYSPETMESKEIHSPKTMESKEIHSPKTMESKEIHSPKTMESKEIHSPKTMKSKEIHSPKTMESKEIHSPKTMESKEIHAPKTMEHTERAETREKSARKVVILNDVRFTPVISKSTDYTTMDAEAQPKCITEFQMIKDMQAKLENAAGCSTPMKEDDALYDFALTDATVQPGTSLRVPNKRPLTDDIEKQSPKRPKLDCKKILQEVSSSAKKKSSKSAAFATSSVKSNTDCQVLERLDVEHFLSVLHR